MEKVAVIMGSKSDWEVMKKACMILDELKISYTKDIVSAHRTPKKLYEFAQSAKSVGYKIIIAGAGGAAHLPGMVASLTTLPVIAVPIMSSKLSGMDSLLSIVQMPSGVSVACMAIDGSINAGLFAASILALEDENLSKRLEEYKEKQTTKVLEDSKLSI